MIISIFMAWWILSACICIKLVLIGVLVQVVNALLLLIISVCQMKRKPCLTLYIDVINNTFCYLKKYTP